MLVRSPRANNYQEENHCLDIYHISKPARAFQREFFVVFKDYVREPFRVCLALRQMHEPFREYQQIGRLVEAGEEMPEMQVAERDHPDQQGNIHPLPIF